MKCFPIDRNALVKNKTIAFPKIFFFGNFFEIFQDSAFELENGFKAQILQKRREFFTADAARAKHRHFFVFRRIEFFRNKFGHLIKFGDFRINRIFKTAEFGFVFVARVENNRFRVGNDFVPVFRFDMRAVGFFDLDLFFESHDFFFDTNFGAFETEFAKNRKFYILISYQNYFKNSDKFFNVFRASADRRIKAFTRQNDRAENFIFDHRSFEPGFHLLQIFRIAQIFEFVKCDDLKIFRFIHKTQQTETRPSGSVYLHYDTLPDGRVSA